MNKIDAEISGSLTIRPLRVGLVFKPTLETVLTAIQHATSAWGGMYFPFIDPTDEAKALRLAARLDVDVLYPIDDDPTSDQLSRQDGYWWGGRKDFGAFGNGIGRLVHHVQGVDWVLDESNTGSSYVNPAWNANDPLDVLFSALYGRLGDDEFGRYQAAMYRKAKPPTNLGSPKEWAIYYNKKTPIRTTTSEMEYTGDPPGNGVILLDRLSAQRLTSFWNLRAAGAEVWPWLVEEEDRSADATGYWLDHALSQGYLSGWRRGDGKELGPQLLVYLPPGSQLPSRLVEICRQRGITCLEDNTEGMGVGGWRGDHPFSTQFKHVFRAHISRQGMFELRLPQLGNARWHRGHQPGVVAAHVNIYSVTGLPPDWTVVTPAVRSLAPLIDKYTPDVQPMHRPTDMGRVVAVQADAATVDVSPIRSFAVMESLMSGSGWSFRQTDGGKFSTRLIEVLGGSASYMANQPGVRAILSEASNSSVGRPFPALKEAAKNRQGAWPDALASEELKNNYPVYMVRNLLSRKVLHAVLPVACPRCTAEAGKRAEDLRTDMVCDLCGFEFPLALALGLHQRNDWLYRLPDNVPASRLNETLPVMAVLSILSSYRSSSAHFPYVLGLKVDGPGVDCEIDVAMALWENHPPLMVVGEVKGYRDTIDATDLTNLVTVQSHLRAKGIECFILAATLRDTLPDVTIAALRSVCENSPTILASHFQPVLPIVLTYRDLSVGPRDKNNPLSWHNWSGSVLSNVAIESCKRNLGLEAIDNTHEGGESRWVAKWRS